MKVLHLIHKVQLRGAEIFASQLASHINESGNQAMVVCLFSGDAVLPYNGPILSLSGNPRGRWYDFKAWKKLAEIIKEANPDVVQANAGDTLKYAVFSKIMFAWKQPIVFRNASTISLYIKTPLQKFWNSWFFSHTNRIISVSHASAADFKKLYPKYAEKVITIPIGIEEEETVHNINKKDRSLMNGQGPRILHVGGFSFEKNHTGLIEIFELVLKQLPSATLYLVGDGPLKKQTEEIVKSKGLGSNVKFCGFRNNAIDYIRSADVLILPSLIEGLPGVLLEAFYCKVPVVAYDVGGIKEIVMNHRTGRLIRKGDQHAFANAIIDAIPSTPNNQQFVENAYNLVTTQYLNTQITRQFLSLYKTVAS